MLHPGSRPGAQLLYTPLHFHNASTKPNLTHISALPPLSLLFPSYQKLQMALGFSRDDAEARFLPAYLKLGILPVDPFEQLDEGVLELIRLAVERGRAARPDLSIGICGEHGGNPASIASLSALGGLDYVSCSPLRVPVARLAAAQAAIQRRRADKGGNDHCQD